MFIGRAEHLSKLPKRRKHSVKGGIAEADDKLT